MEERHYSEKPASERKREKMRIAGENLIASVPPVRVVERIRLEVPTIVVPVAVDRPENAHFCTLRHPYHHPLNILRIESDSGH